MPNTRSTADRTLSGPGALEPPRGPDAPAPTLERVARNGAPLPNFAGNGHSDVLHTLSSRLQAVASLNEELNRELTRCYSHLNAIFEITEGVANLRCPEAIREALLLRYAGMLEADAAYVAAPDNSIRCVGRMDRHVDLPGEEVIAERLADEIAQVRVARRSRHASRSPTEPTATWQALLGALAPRERAVEVVIAVRAPGRVPFDPGDLLASETVLVYGGQILGNALLVHDLEEASFATVRALTRVMDARDSYTCGHSERVAWLARMTGKVLGLSRQDLQTLEWAGVLHDVGKLGVPEIVLNKPGPLTPEEFERVKQHPRLGFEILRPVPSLRPALEAVLHHHENHDGSGYPSGLAGEDVPLLARILHVVDVFDALTSARPYRGRMLLEDSFNALRAGSGRSTDPHVTRVFIRAFSDYARCDPKDFARRFGHVALRAHVASESSTLQTTGDSHDASVE